MAAYRDRDPAGMHLAATLVIVACFALPLGIVLWRLWTHVIAGLAL